MRLPAVACLLFALMAQNGHAAAEQVITLPLPHALQVGDTAWIQVQVGVIGPGQEIELTTASGRELGVISPYGVRLGQASGIYTLPVPADAIRDDRIALRLTITQAGTAARAPTMQEVRSVKLILNRDSH
ncbi:hypothetical protein [Dyella silvatica]|uniref:hypothetical protein n=1 Tax=Dyella silvatica TaxID=2992128 RepID=UPI0022587BB3|nr:hypothetical protein [Dyella silvatica]